jgi:tRNA-dihydrouridine synthase B
MGETGIRSVQSAGADPDLMAEAAAFNEKNGAQIIDINMGCPAKKVNKKMAGSALMQYPELVEKNVKAVVGAVKVPVTLKTRTGWDPDNRNGLEIAKIAERNGIQCLAIHGRTRACMYKGNAEYHTIKEIKEAIKIPVIANGDIRTPQQAKEVLEFTNADGLMIGRGAQGRPWIFREVDHFLRTGHILAPPEKEEVRSILLEHVANLHQLYGDVMGPRIARKHVGWYLEDQDTDRSFRKLFNGIESGEVQIETLNGYFDQI